jgi:hypothetical protein
MEQDWTNEFQRRIEIESALREKIAADVRTYAEVAGLRKMDPQYLAALLVAEQVVLLGLGEDGVLVGGPLS